MLAGTVVCAQSTPAPAAAPLRFDAASISEGPSSVSYGPVFNTGDDVRMIGVSILEIIRFGWGYDNDRIWGGPVWLAEDRFNVTARTPHQATYPDRQQMVRTLLAERFRLVAHETDLSIPGYGLLLAKKGLLKPAEGEGPADCEVTDRSGQIITTSTFSSPSFDGRIEAHCHNITIAGFISQIPRFFGGPGPANFVDHTELTGRWSFELIWTVPRSTATQEQQVSFADALAKVGIRLESTTVSRKGLVVESVERRPSTDPPGTAANVRPIILPSEFEVADIRPSDPTVRGPFRFDMQRGGRFFAENVPVVTFVLRAFGGLGLDSFQGIPEWAMTQRINVTAKVPDEVADLAPVFDFQAPLLLSLLRDRYGLVWHNESRQVNGFSFVASKPKLQKANPASRRFCRLEIAPPDATPGTTMVRCQNATLTMFGKMLPRLGTGSGQPVEDASGLEGGFDFTFRFNPTLAYVRPQPAPGSNGDVATASDPTGVPTIFDALDKQLGLRLERRKRALPVIVIDHLNREPTEN